MLSESRKNDVANDVSALRKKAGTWLRERRIAVGLSQRELAHRVSMEYYTFISQIEAGRGRVPAERFKEWADALEMDPREFAITLMRYYDPHSFDMIFGAGGPKQ